MAEFSDFLSSSVAEFHYAMEDFEDVQVPDFDEEFDEENPDELIPETAVNYPTPLQLLPPPTDQPFPTLAALIQKVNLHAAKQGYAVVKAGYKKNGNKEVIKNWLKCSQGGKYKDRVDPDLRVREGAVCTTECRLEGVQQKK